MVSPPNGNAADMETFAPELDPRAFRSALGCFATGVTVVTARDDLGEPIGKVTQGADSVVPLNQVCHLAPLFDPQTVASGDEQRAQGCGAKAWLGAVLNP